MLPFETKVCQTINYTGEQSEFVICGNDVDGLLGVDFSLGSPSFCDTGQQSLCKIEFLESKT